MNCIISFTLYWIDWAKHIVYSSILATVFLVVFRDTSITRRIDDVMLLPFYLKQISSSSVSSMSMFIKRWVLARMLIIFSLYSTTHLVLTVRTPSLCKWYNSSSCVLYLWVVRPHKVTLIMHEGTSSFFSFIFNNTSCFIMAL